MAKKFFPEDWEKINSEEMIRARARLAGFIESIPDKDKAIRDVSIIFEESKAVLFEQSYGLSQPFCTCSVQC